MRIVPLSFLFVLVIGCSDLGTSPSDGLVNSTGMIIEQSTQLFLIVSDSPLENNFKTFYPLNLSDSFKHDSLRIRFSGKLQSDPPSPYPYPSLTLTFIESIQN